MASRLPDSTAHQSACRFGDASWLPEPIEAASLAAPPFAGVR